MTYKSEYQRDMEAVGMWKPDAVGEIKRLRQELADIIIFAETRRQDGIEMGATVWRIALEDIIQDARNALAGVRK